jgi:uncharacterized membrane protein
MESLTKIGRLLYGIGLVAVGIHQLLLKDFRPEILPPFPAWAHQFVIFPILAAIALIFSGIMISGLFTTRPVIAKYICLSAGFCFLILVITCHLPYVLIFSADKASRLDGWFDVGEELAYCGGAFVMAGSFAANNPNRNKKGLFLMQLEKLIPLGRIFFAILMLLFGCSHFVFTDFVATMVPKWIGAPLFSKYG